jgi:hypothetical protein
MASAVAQEASKQQLTARELFYYSAHEPAQVPKKNAGSAAAGTKKAPGRAAPKEPAAVVPTQPAGHPAKELPDGGRITATVAAGQSTAPPPAEGLPLGLKYTLKKLIDGQPVPVSPDSVFHAGDRIQFDVEINDSGYLYIVSQGSSGTWKPMFPSPEIEDGNNRVEPFRSYSMPPKSRFYFDEQPGAEKLFLVLSRHPVPDLEEMIHSLQGSRAKPAATPPASDGRPPEVLRASIDDGTVGRLRDAYARDLLIEKADEPTPGGEKKDSAVYVVNPKGSGDSRVVADVILVHR